MMKVGVWRDPAALLQFMGDNKRLLQFHEQKLSDLEAFKSDTHMFQKNTSASLKNLETQVGQLALNVPNQNNFHHLTITVSLENSGLDNYF